MSDSVIDDSHSEILGKPAISLFAFACGVTTANVYYAQSIASAIARSLHISADLAGPIVTTTQFGYGIGLFFIVCLADLFENRRLVLLLTAGTACSLLGVATSTSASLFFAASLALGVCTVGSQILVPMAVHLSTEANRGKILGQIMAGLVTGIMLSRPLASFLTAHWGWRAVYYVSSVVMAVTFGMLAWALPRWQPTPTRRYLATLKSTLNLLRTSRPLQRRAAYQGGLFAIFNMFWTAVPLLLHERMGLSQTDIAMFALAGAAGAFSAPLAGHVADQGKTWLGTATAMGCSAAALLISGGGQAIRSVSILVIAAIVLDAATQANQVFGQRTIHSLDASARGRLNSGYMTVIFVCGAIGSSLGSLTFYHGGWWLLLAVGCLIALAVFCFLLSEKHRSH